VSGNVLELSGFSSEEFMSGLVPYADIVHPEDAERVASEVESFSSDIRIQLLSTSHTELLPKTEKLNGLMTEPILDAMIQERYRIMRGLLLMSLTK
jgi:hypothetical protein